MDINEIAQILGDEADHLLHHVSQTIPRDQLHLPGSDFVNRVFVESDRNPAVLRNLALMYKTGRLAETGYTSILPIDQGVEHTAGAVFSPNPIYFDSENIIRLAIEGNCNAVATTLGVLGTVARKYVAKIPFILKINHNELLSFPNTHDQRLFASVKQAFELGAVGIGATIYFGSEDSRRQLEEIGEAFEQAHELGMFTVLWCYLRNDGFRTEEGDFHNSADMSSQAIHLGVTIEADLVKQKLPVTNRGFEVLKFGKTHPDMYDKLSSDHPIDMVRYQLANAYMGRIGLINSGGDSGDNDYHDAVRAAVINKRAGGTGLIMGRKAFQKPMEEGVKILHAVQDVYLNGDVTVA